MTLGAVILPADILDCASPAAMAWPRRSTSLAISSRALLRSPLEDAADVIGRTAQYFAAEHSRGGQIVPPPCDLTRRLTCVTSYSSRGGEVVADERTRQRLRRGRREAWLGPHQRFAVVGLRGSAHHGESGQLVFFLPAAHTHRCALRPALSALRGFDAPGSEYSILQVLRLYFKRGSAAHGALATPIAGRRQAQFVCHLCGFGSRRRHRGDGGEPAFLAEWLRFTADKWRGRSAGSDRLDRIE